MATFITELLAVLSALLIVVDPLPVAPMFASMTAGRTPREVRGIVTRASLAGAGLLIFFTLFGGAVFKALGLQLSAFRAGGGLLLMLTAIDMLRAKASRCICSPAELKDAAQKEDIAIVPVATPMLAGPGAIATVMVLSAEHRGPAGLAAVILAILVTFAVTYVVLRLAPLIGRVLGVSGLALVQRVMGLLLAALSIQFMVDGVRRLLA